LVPQAQTVFESVLGGYQAGTSTVASMLLAERELLELQLAEFKAQADHAVALARLEALVGRPVRLEAVR
jgi:outer membrane protein TolC